MIRKNTIFQPNCLLEKTSRKNPPIKALLKPMVLEEVYKFIKITAIKTISRVNPNMGK